MNWESVANMGVRLVTNIIPAPDAEHADQYRWRKGVAVFLLVLGLGDVSIGVHIAWACGVLPGFPGFATINDVQTVSEEDNAATASLNKLLKLIVRKDIARDIRDLRSRQCAISRANNEALKQELTNTLYKDLTDYRDQTGQDYILPPCDEM